jgi:hypothetical protein
LSIKRKNIKKKNLKNSRGAAKPAAKWILLDIKTDGEKDSPD